jgi:hypothetical protein
MRYFLDTEFIEDGRTIDLIIRGWKRSRLVLPGLDRRCL